MSNWREMLKEAKEFFDDGLIDETEYRAEKARIMKMRSQTTNPPSSGGSLANFGGKNTDGGISDTFAGEHTQFQGVGQTIGNYRILGELGQGGMGMVYRARHKVESFAQQTGDVVIKLMHAQYAQDPSFRERFISEAAIGRNIHHSNIVRIHDVIVEENKNILAIVMDLVEGQSLEKWIPKGGLEQKTAFHITKQLCEAIDHLHSQEIIHRDLKPENIIVSQKGKVTILDMGIAKNSQNRLSGTQTGMAMGTPLYMAPEQGDAKNVTSAADRYALGLIVYQMLSGEFPWASDTSEWSIVSHKMSGNLIPLKEKVNVQGHLSDAVMKLLRSQEQDRWSSCAEFWKAFQKSSTEYLKPYHFGTGKAQPTMVLIPTSEFMMGALPNDKEAYDDEKPLHKVRITKDFYVGKYPVTQTLWESVMGNNPSYFKGANRPVENVSWFDCVEFCNKLSKLEGKELVYTINGENVTYNWGAKGYRLLTEAEWEYCARANQDTLYSGSNNPDEVAWYRENSGFKTYPVGQKKPNGFGLHDMSGNIWEWCWDWYGEYSTENQSNPTGKSTSSRRVGRGGGWRYSPRDLRVSNRVRHGPTYRFRDLGFRLGHLL